MMVPVEHTNWMALAYDYTLDYGGVRWASRLPVDCSGVSVSSLGNFSREL